jgi:hypothetical protein
MLFDIFLQFLICFIRTPRLRAERIEDAACVPIAVTFWALAMVIHCFS